LTLQNIWQEILSLPSIHIDDNFFVIGGHSLLAVILIGRCNKAFDTSLPLSSIFEHPTIEGIAMLVRTEYRAQHSTSLIPLQAAGRNSPLFCIHPAGGTVFCYMNLTHALGLDQPVLGLQALGLERGEKLADSIEEMVSAYTAEIRRAQPYGPYHLLGWSFGGLVAQAIACHLQELGEEVALLALLDTNAPVHDPALLEDTAGIIEELAKVIIKMGAGEPIAGPIRTLEKLTEIARQSRIFPPDFTIEQCERLTAVYARTIRLSRQYVPSRYTGNIHLFVAATQPGNRDLLGWSPYIDGDIAIIPMSCSHDQMTAIGASEKIAATLAMLIAPPNPVPEGRDGTISAK
jgi:thioesterase domain-containing protein/acyl carrier protein